ncbi:MAG: prsT [Cyanobacteria bacterium RYN_339]|nr:prsT [Cyanobacteria bacterium RYN_339]
MSRKFGQDVAGNLMVIATGLYMLFPGAREITEIRVRAANLEQAIQILETEQRKGTTLDESLDDRLFGAYEATGKRTKALQELARRGRQRELTPAERLRAKKLALAEGMPYSAVQLLEGPHEHQNVPRHEDLVELSLAAGRPHDAWRHGAAVALSKPDDLKAWVRRRDLALGAAEPTDAVTAQRRVAVLEPGEPQSRRLADLQVGAGDPAGALTTLEAIAHPSDPVELHQVAARTAEWARLPGRAIPHWYAIFQAKPEAQLGHKLLFTLAARRDGRAVEMARDLLKRYPDQTRIAADCRSILLANGRKDEVQVALADAVRRAPDDSGAHTALVDFSLGQSARPVALQELDRWLGRHPNDRAARHQMAVVRVWDGQAEKGWDDYAQLFAANQAGADPMGVLELRWRQEWLAISRAVDDFTAGGRSNLETMVKVSPDDPKLRRRLALAKMEAGDSAEAIDDMRKVATMGRATEDRQLLAEWLGWYGQDAESLAVLRQLDAEKPMDAVALRDAADRAATTRRWTDAKYFGKRLVAVAPRDSQAWDGLARAFLASGDLVGAGETWQRRAHLLHDNDGLLTAAEVFSRAGQPQKALAALEAAGPGVRPNALRWRAQLATKLHLDARAAQAWEVLLKRQPADLEALRALIAYADKRGNAAEGDQRFAAVLATQPNDGEMLVEAAIRWAERHPDRARSALQKLEQLPRPGPDALRLLADHAQAGDPAKAAMWLDKLHAAGAGDAETYFRRGELAVATNASEAAQDSFEHSAKLGTRTGASAGEREAGAYALERLGRADDARKLWEALIAAGTNRPAAFLSVARAKMRMGEQEAAGKLLAQAAKLSPGSLDVSLARVDWLKAQKLDEAAADELGAAAKANPGETYLAAAEAMARHDLGQYTRARLLAKNALAAHPANPDLAEVNRAVRELATPKVSSNFSHDAWGSFDRRKYTLHGTQPLGDRLTIDTDVSHVNWEAGATAVTDVAVTVGSQSPRGAASLNVTLPVGAGGPQAPLGNLSGTWNPDPTVQVRGRLEEARWEDTNKLAADQAREHRVGAQATWRPGNGPLSVNAEASVGQLTAGATSGLGHAEAVGATLSHPSGAVFTSYQLQNRTWGAAGQANGLPDSVMTQRLSIGHAGRVGPVHYEIQPGVTHQGATGFAPAVDAAVSVELGHDAEVGIQGGWGATNFVTGGADGYHSVEVTGKVYF